MEEKIHSIYFVAFFKPQIVTKYGIFGMYIKL